MISNIPTNYTLNWEDRPELLKKHIHGVFKKLSEKKKSSWGTYNGDYSYEMFGIREGRCLKKMIQTASKAQKEFYVLDIGAGDFQFVRDLVEYINSQEDIPHDVTVHVIGIRGESGEEKKERVGKCMLYELTAFKIEDLFEEFKNKNLNLEKKVDFAISRWCFRHFADPTGTFVQTYNTVRPGTGLLIMDGFFSLDKDQKVEEILRLPTGALIDLFVRTKSPFLMQHYGSQGSLDRFILRRRDDMPCLLNMRYLENFELGIKAGQNGSDCITRFDKGKAVADWDYFEEKDYTEKCLYGDKVLYDWLRKNHIIDPSLDWGRAKNDTLNRFQLHDAVKRGDLQGTQRLLAEGHDIDEPNPKGYTPLHIAMKEKQLECFTFLLDKGAETTMPSCDGFLVRSKRNTLLVEAENRGYDKEYIEILKRRSSTQKS